ncbi:SanA/YdcF family protein [Nocardiopsis ansamitocini]|nr:ElyC/SanA/YdcF family protein [Nocardiopsis ansamitocini]
MVVGALMGGAALAAGPTAWTYLASARYRFAPAAVPARPVAIVLGAGVRSDGQPTLLLARRLDIAVELVRAGKVGAVLVSGDNRPCSGRETDVMTRYLVRRGVPEGAITADPAGYRTWDTCARARDSYGVRSAVIVTQSFHLPRAVALARAAGLDAVGVGDPSLAGRSRATAYGYVREFGANTKALRDAVLRPAPADTSTGAADEVERLAKAT